MNDQRKHFFLGMPVGALIKFIVVLIVLGLVQFGIFWNKFTHGELDRMTIHETLKSHDARITMRSDKDIYQDARIDEVERRVRDLERSLRNRGR